MACYITNGHLLKAMASPQGIGVRSEFSRGGGGGGGGGGAKPNQGEGAGGGCAPSRAKRESFQCYSVL